MNDGWLCDSILKTAASPSPISTAPAFSPGPCSTRGPRVGSFLQMDARALVAAVLRPHHREDAELGDRRLASERADDPVVFVAVSGRGVRGARYRWLIVQAVPTAPADASARTTDSNSTSPSPLPSIGSQARSGCGIMPTTLRRSLQMPAMLRAAPFGFAALGRLAARGIDVAENHAPIAFELVEHVVGREVVALAVVDRNAQDLAACRQAPVNGVSVCSTRMLTCSQMELQAAVAQHRAGQQARFEQDLEAVADAEHRTAGIGERLHRGHHRREPRDRAGAQVVAVREPARQDDDVGAAELRVLVPDELGLLPEHVLGGVVGVVVAVRSGKNDDGEFHVICRTSCRFQCCASAMNGLLADLDPIGLDDGIGQQLVGHVADRPSSLLQPTPRPPRARSTCPAARRRRRCSPSSAAPRRWCCPVGRRPTASR